jgi:Tol biopolymer transport system component/predicted Ser/Thr protein kinase
MSLQAGTKLGQYEVRELIGKGGMGEVYKGYDTQLKRDVALKVLPDEFARDADRLARFRREATLLASLNHSNIAAIYRLEESGGIHALVMEFVPGDTLADRIRRDGPFPLEESLDIAKQICDALEHAHEKPIIHRDLKPANVKLTPEGKVKVLDFGLAKAFAGDSTAGDSPKPFFDSNSPTLSRLPEGYREPDFSPTLPGVILGTAAYMSPEQARGKTVDKRTDIWAFGCVLYELLTGKQTFTGDNVTDILASVVKSEPDWSLLSVETPAYVRGILRRCLQKDKTQRLRDAADVRIQIEEGRAASPTGAGPSPKLWQRAMPWAVGALLGLVAGIAVWSLKPAPIPVAQSPAHVAINLPPGDRLVTAGYPPVAFSPDGSRLAYVAIHNGVQQLFLRAMDSREAKPLPGSESAESPFFSPDSQWIGFFALGKLKKISIAGGAPQTLCDSGSNAGASWGTDDTIVFSPSNSSGLMRVSAAGGMPQVLTTLDHSQGELSHRLPQFLPGGKALLFTVYSGAGWDEKHTATLRLDTGERRIVLRGGHTGRFVPTGYLVYGRAGTLLAAPFDPVRLEVTSSAPITIAEGVTESVTTAGAEYSFSAVGSLAYVPASPRQFERRLVWVDRNGAVEPLPAPQRNYGAPALSSDGQRVAVIISSGTTELWIYDLARGTLTRLTTEGGSQSPLWTPDGKRIAYRGTKSGFRNVFWKAADGSGAEERLTTGENNQFPDSWSPDGKWLAFRETSPTTGEDIWMLRIEGMPSRASASEGDRRQQPFLRTPFNESGSAFSPDSLWLAYQSDESGRNEVYIQPFSGPGPKWHISTDGGTEPVWARNGRELFYRNGNKMMAVDVTTSPAFSAGKPRLLFEGQFAGGGDVSPDGQRFLMIQAVEPEQPATQINVVLNWFEELKQKAPVK